PMAFFTLPWLRTTQESLKKRRRPWQGCGTRHQRLGRRTFFARSFIAIPPRSRKFCEYSHSRRTRIDGAERPQSDLLVRRSATACSHVIGRAAFLIIVVSIPPPRRTRAVWTLGYPVTTFTVLVALPGRN